MADFLTRLIERTMGAAPSVQPLLPSKYEQVHLTGPDHRRSVSVSEALRNEYPSNVSPGDPRTRPAQSQKGDERVIGEEVVAIDPEGADKDNSVSHANDEVFTPAKDRSGHDGHLFSHAPSHASINTGSEIIQPMSGSSVKSAASNSHGLSQVVIHSDMSDNEKRHFREACTRSSQSEVRNPEGHRIPDQARNDKQSEIHDAMYGRQGTSISGYVEGDGQKRELIGEDRAVVKEDTPAASIARRASHAVIRPINVVRSDAGRTMESEQRKAVSATQPQPAPTIKITIGRVEVRAVMEQTRTKGKPAPPAPRMSLDDYLKQRDRGGR